ncbi:glycoprotein-N-acetylgalactosamine 3-beta-galactosyltransferase [Achlya hypogyna]|uniref:N-acetylgalactosaminide beta-1,3-galactosyltransferase n=1 Tax=Achlya hypogyna TaxID=1202772 RepID=A0A1V9ZTC5_ACHHY|nr:glycoprotein-N-acetylgalactosamine 3-beta-galactosyltransferase [Achlya hypogyna]
MRSVVALLAVVAWLTLAHGISPKELRDVLCSIDVDESNAALDLVRVARVAQAPRILCFVNTISPHHATKAQTIKDTWGKRCDKLVFLSNATDVALGAVALVAPSDHDHLWQKHKASIAYIWEHFRHEYDWFYKADDDAYVILENLRAYLRSPEIVMQQDVEPLQLGHRFRVSRDLMEYYVQDKAILREYVHRWRYWWLFNSGGPGYAMNKLYMQRAVESFPEPHCFSDEYSDMVPDDVAISFCMAFAGASPTNTRDLHGRERWHANNPRT